MIKEHMKNTKNLNIVISAYQQTYKGIKMKKIILALMFVSANSYATGSLTFNNFEAEASASSISKSAGGNGGAGGNVNYESHEHKQPVSSAIAPAVSINEVCPVVTVGGHAAQFFGFGISTTGMPSINSFCAAMMLKQYGVAQQILCNSDSTYKKAMKQTGTTCAE